MNEIIQESRSGDISSIISFCAVIYSHLMEFTAVTPKSSSWLDSIKNSIDGLSKITNESYWRQVENDPVKLRTIKNKAISIYTNDGNPHADQFFTIVYKELPNIRLFRSYEPVKRYLLNIAKNDYKLEELIKNKFNEGV